MAVEQDWCILIGNALKVSMSQRARLVMPMLYDEQMRKSIMGAEAYRTYDTCTSMDEWQYYHYHAQCPQFNGAVGRNSTNSMQDGLLRVVGHNLITLHMEGSAIAMRIVYREANAL